MAVIPKSVLETKNLYLSILNSRLANDISGTILCFTDSKPPKDLREEASISQALLLTGTRFLESGKAICQKYCRVLKIVDTPTPDKFCGKILSIFIPELVASAIILLIVY